MHVAVLVILSFTRGRNCYLLSSETQFQVLCIRLLNTHLMPNATHTGLSSVSHLNPLNCKFAFCTVMSLL